MAPAAAARGRPPAFRTPAPRPPTTTAAAAAAAAWVVHAAAAGREIPIRLEADHHREGWAEISPAAPPAAHWARAGETSAALDKPGAAAVDLAGFRPRPRALRRTCPATLPSSPIPIP